MIPCHRVVGTSGSLTGYAGGLDRKIALLKLEKAYRPHFSFRKNDRPLIVKRSRFLLLLLLKRCVVFRIGKWFIAGLEKFIISVFFGQIRLIFVNGNIGLGDSVDYFIRLIR